MHGADQSNAEASPYFPNMTLSQQQQQSQPKTTTTILHLFLLHKSELIIDRFSLQVLLLFQKRPLN